VHCIFLKVRPNQDATGASLWISLTTRENRELICETHASRWAIVFHPFHTEPNNLRLDCSTIQKKTISFPGFNVVDILEPTRLTLTRFRDTALRILGKAQNENCRATCNNEYKIFPNFTKTAELLKA